MLEDRTAGTCPVCGGHLCVDLQYPDRVYCDTCEYEFGVATAPCHPGSDGGHGLRGVADAGAAKPQNTTSLPRL